MREFLFRGKHIHALQKNKHLDGKWIEGYLSDKNYINSPELEGEFLIDPETVCQYTGLTDKNGRKIFEGDILLHESVGKVKVVFEKSEFLAVGISHDMFSTLLSSIYKDCEAIGNIFDNSELLEGGIENV